MGFTASPRTLVPVLAFFIFTLLLWNTGKSSATFSSIMSSSSKFDPSSALAVSISSTDEGSSSSSSPPTVKLSVTNNHNQPITVLRWDTPLDPMAFKLGVLSLYKGDGTPLELMTASVRRLMPPAEDQFITIAPGETAVNEVELGAPVVSEDLGLEGKKIEVQASGQWTYAWPMDNQAVLSRFREKIGGAESDGASRGHFSSNKHEVQF